MRLDKKKLKEVLILNGCIKNYRETGEAEKSLKEWISIHAKGGKYSCVSAGPGLQCTVTKEGWSEPANIWCGKGCKLQ